MPNIYTISKTSNLDTQNFCGGCTTPLQPAKDISVARPLKKMSENIQREPFALRDMRSAKNSATADWLKFTEYKIRRWSKIYMINKSEGNYA